MGVDRIFSKVLVRNKYTYFECSIEIEKSISFLIGKEILFL